MKKLLVSACLLGKNCRYDGKNNLCITEALLRENGISAIPVCPECDGGLSVPRSPAEIKSDRVITKAGEDVTHAFQKGAEIALKKAISEGCRLALLKERSPSCGKGQIYDGSFQKRLTDGNGITAALLLQNGVEIFGESELSLLMEKLKK